jgi:uncharacterized membrane protein
MTFTSRATKWFAIALTVSLALNIFFAGFMVARWWGWGHPGWAMMGMERSLTRGDRPMPMLDRMAARLPEPDRTKFEAIVARHRPALTEFGKTIRENRRKLRDLLTAERIDRPAIETAMADVRERSVAFQRTMQTAILEAAEGLSPEARRQLLPNRRFGRDEERR